MGCFLWGLAELVGGSLFCVILTGSQERVLFQPPQGISYNPRPEGGRAQRANLARDQP